MFFSLMSWRRPRTQALVFVFSALCSVTSFSAHPRHAIGCPTALRWRTTPWSALCAWSRWRLMTSTSSPAPVATRSAVSAGIASAQTRTASAPPAERWGSDETNKSQAEADLCALRGCVQLNRCDDVELSLKQPGLFQQVDHQFKCSTSVVCCLLTTSLLATNHLLSILLEGASFRLVRLLFYFPKDATKNALFFSLSV